MSAQAALDNAMHKYFSKGSVPGAVTAKVREECSEVKLWRRPGIFGCFHKQLSAVQHFLSFCLCDLELSEALFYLNLIRKTKDPTNIGSVNMISGHLFLTIILLSSKFSHGLLTSTCRPSRINPLNSAMKTEKDIPPLNSSPPLRIALLVEPTPFGYISGYSNRFKEMLKFLQKAGDQVQILTPDGSETAPDDYLGYPVINVKGFRFPWYKAVTLSLDIKGRTAQILENFKPDILHVTSPGTLVFPAMYYAYKYNVPLVMSYHTHLPVYVKSYIGLPGIVALSERVVRLVHSRADLTLTTSPQLKEELESFGMRRVDVWQKGIDVERFSPEFRSQDMRSHLTQGHPDAPLLVYIGRLGVEKKLKNLRKVLDANPSARLAFVGKGPSEDDLKSYFKNYN
eukprot:gene4063-8079_t